MGIPFIQCSSKSRLGLLVGAAFTHTHTFFPFSLSYARLRHITFTRLDSPRTDAHATASERKESLTDDAWTHPKGWELTVAALVRHSTGSTAQ